MAEENQEIQCERFLRKEQEIKDLTHQINQEPNAKGKANKARLYLDRVQLLLECPEYNSEKLDCRICRGVAETRERTAELVIKTSELGL